MLRFLISFSLILQLALTPAFAIVSRPHDAVINNGVNNLVHGQDFFDGLDQVGRTFLVSETMAIAQFGIGELGNGSDAQWEGSFGHALLHGGVGCIAAELLEGDCFAGLASGIGQSIFAGSLSGTDLSDSEQRARAQLIGSLIGYTLSGGRAVNVTAASQIFASGITYNRQLHRNEIEWIQENAAAFIEFMCSERNICGLSSNEAIALLRNEALEGVSDDFVNIGSADARAFIEASYSGPDIVNGQTMFGQLHQNSDEYENSIINLSYVNDYIDFYSGISPNAYNAGLLSGQVGDNDLSYELLLIAAAYDVPYFIASGDVSAEENLLVVAGLSAAMLTPFVAQPTIVFSSSTIKAITACTMNPLCWAEMTMLGGEVALGATNAVQGQAFVTVAATGTALAGKVILQKGDEIIAVLDDLGRLFRPVSQTVDDAGKFLVTNSDNVVGHLGRNGFVPRLVTNTAGGSSRIVPGGGLRAHESAGGHLIERHVGRTDAELVARLNSQPHITAASSFPNRATAERAVSSALDANGTRIGNFLGGTDKRLVIDYRVGSPVGNVVVRGSTTPVPASNVRIVLQRDASMPTGYRIVTGYPTP